jgi:hypothetical protein
MPSLIIGFISGKSKWTGKWMEQDEPSIPFLAILKH